MKIKNINKNILKNIYKKINYNQNKMKKINCMKKEKKCLINKNSYLIFIQNNYQKNQY